MPAWGATSCCHGRKGLSWVKRWTGKWTAFTKLPLKPCTTQVSICLFAVILIHTQFMGRSCSNLKNIYITTVIWLLDLQFPDCSQAAEEIPILLLGANRYISLLCSWEAESYWQLGAPVSPSVPNQTKYRAGDWISPHQSTVSSKKN